MYLQFLELKNNVLAACLPFLLALQLMLALDSKVDGYVAFCLYFVGRFWHYNHFIMYFVSSMFRLNFKTFY